MTDPVRIANCSGVLGDRFTALSEAVHGDPRPDVIIGDYMAEITMSKVAGTSAETGTDPRAFHADYFARQITPELRAIAERGIKVVSNAGIFDPAGLAERLRAEVREQGLDLRVAHVEGDDLFDRVGELAADSGLRHLDTGAPFVPDDRTLTANAYLGGWGIAAALRAGADIVVTGRVADASLVLGPAAWWHDWKNDDWDRIAGAVAAAHIIECGPQATGGNFSGFQTIPDNTLLAFPVAEVADDGSSVITKRPADGGAVTVDTVTAQLMYEIQGPHYLNPDVVLHVDTVRLTQEGPDRVRVSGVRGTPPPTTTKVGIHRLAGYRSGVWVFPTGISAPAMVDVLRRQAEKAAAGFDLDETRVTVCGRPATDPADQYEATTPVYVAASAQKPGQVRGFLATFCSYGLGSIPGYYVDLSGPIGTEVRRIEYWPAIVDQSEPVHEVVHDDGRRARVELPPREEWGGQPAPTPASNSPQHRGETTRRPLGEVAFARTGDKGGNANLGVWTPAQHADAYPWLCAELTVERLRELLGAGEDIVIERYELPALHGISFVLRDYFGPSGSGNLALDQIGKSTGEFLRARLVDIPTELLHA